MPTQKSRNPLPMRAVMRAMRTAARWREEGTDRPEAVAASDQSQRQHHSLEGVFLGLPGVEARPPVPADEPRAKLEYVTRIVPNIGRSVVGVFRSAQVMRRNPQDPRRELSAGEVAGVERVARQYGADLVGYTRLDPDYVFAGRRVLDRNVIVLGMEMDHDAIATSPHLESEAEVHRVYAELGLAAFKVAKHLRRLGVAAQAGTALGGDSNYPPLAEAAGLGKVGYNGLLLTDEFGPRLRLAVVYCSVDTLPFHDRSETRHDWIRGFCETCRACVRKCPTDAIYDTATEHPNGSLSHIDSERCFPYFRANYGCAVCIKVCPFSEAKPDRLRASYERWLERGAPRRGTPRRDRHHAPEQPAASVG